MSQSEKRLRELAGRIAHNIEAPAEMVPSSRMSHAVMSSDDRHALSEIRELLMKLETQLNTLEASNARDVSHVVIGSSPNWGEHPSQEKFAVDEAVSEMVDFFEGEKICQMEPGDKPCDHCALCSSRGF